MTTSAIRYALCIQQDLLPLTYREAYRTATQPGVYPVVEELFAHTSILADRADCETDESLKQFLPYLVVTNPKGELFSYYRGGAGHEARLHGNISIGLGGHVDELPPYVGGVYLHALLEREAHRELKEEIGVSVSAHIDFSGVIIDPTNPVGRVHLGLLAHVRLSETDWLYLELEEGMIEKGEFRSLMDLRRPETYDRLENWSRAVVDHLLKHPH